MDKHLTPAGPDVPYNDDVRRPHLVAWLRTESATVMHLSDGSVQVLTYIICLLVAFVQDERFHFD